MKSIKENLIVKKYSWKEKCEKKNQICLFEQNCIVAFEKRETKR